MLVCGDIFTGWPSAGCRALIRVKPRCVRSAWCWYRSDACVIWRQGRERDAAARLRPEPVSWRLSRRRLGSSGNSDLATVLQEKSRSDPDSRPDPPDGPLLRPVVAPDPENGLRTPSRLMVDKV